MNKKPYFIFLIFIIPIIIGSLFFIYYFDKPLGGDALEYDLLGWNLAQGNGYSLSANAPYEPTMSREPFYPFFLACLYTLFGHRIFVVYIVQILLFSITCIFSFLIAKEIFGEKIAKYSVLLTALCPTLVNYAMLLYSENVFIFLFILTIYFFIRAYVNNRDTKWFIFSGFLLGLTTLCKGIMSFFFVFFIILIYLNVKSFIGFLKGYALKIILFLLIFLITVSPWIIRNYNLFGILNLNPQGSWVLLGRTYRSNYPIEKLKASAVYYFSEYLGSKLYPNVFSPAKDAMLEQGHLLIQREKQLQEQGLTLREIRDIFRKEAAYLIKKHPFRFIFTTPLELMRLMSFMYIPILYGDCLIDKFKNIKNGALILSLIRGSYRIIAYPLIFLVIFSIYLYRAQWRKNLIVLAPVLYINLLYSLLSGYPRYSVPLIPFYLMFATAAVIGILERGRH